MNEKRRRLILLTRPIEDCITLGKRLQKNGFQTAHCPMLEIRTKIVDEHIDINNYDGLIFTSKNAVKAFGQYNQLNNKNLKIYAVGASTAGALKSAGYNNIHFTNESRAQSLARHIAQDVKKQETLLYLRGKSISANLKTLIPQINSNITIDETIIYNSNTCHNIPTDIIDLLKSKQIDYITFFSERTGKTFSNLIHHHNLTRTLEHIKCLCFSDKVLCSVKDLNWLSTHTCTNPTIESLLGMLHDVEGSTR